MDAVKEMEEVAIYNLYEMRPEDAYNIDLWSKIISQASALVFQFPLYWMSAPSLLKKWQDVPKESQLVLYLYPYRVYFL